MHLGTIMKSIPVSNKKREHAQICLKLIVINKSITTWIYPDINEQYITIYYNILHLPGVEVLFTLLHLLPSYLATGHRLSYFILILLALILVSHTLQMSSWGLLRKSSSIYFHTFSLHTNCVCQADLSKPPFTRYRVWTEVFYGTKSSPTTASLAS